MCSTRFRVSVRIPVIRRWLPPTSQIVGTQAVFNVITGERYKMCTNEFKDMVAGKYGTTPMPIDPEFQKKIIGDAPVITGRPADLLEPELDTLRKEMAQWSEQEEDVLSYAMFPKVSLDFFKKRQEKKYGIDGKHADKEKMIHPCKMKLKAVDLFFCQPLFCFEKSGAVFKTKVIRSQDQKKESPRRSFFYFARRPLAPPGAPYLK